MDVQKISNFDHSWISGVENEWHTCNKIYNKSLTWCHYQGKPEITRNAESVFTYMCVSNNYWMTLSMLSWITKTEVCVICLSLRLRQIIQTRGFDNSWYHAKSVLLYILILRNKGEALSHSVPEENTSRGLATRQPSYCKKIECSRPIRFFIVSLTYDKYC